MQFNDGLSSRSTSSESQFFHFGFGAKQSCDVTPGLLPPSRDAGVVQFKRSTSRISAGSEQSCDTISAKYVLQVLLLTLECAFINLHQLPYRSHDSIAGSQQDVTPNKTVESESGTGGNQKHPYSGILRQKKPAVGVTENNNRKNSSRFDDSSERVQSFPNRLLASVVSDDSFTHEGTKRESLYAEIPVEKVGCEATQYRNCH